MTTITTQGVFRHGRIELDREIGVPEGTRLTLTIQPVRMTQAEWEIRVRELSARGPLDPTFVAAVKQIVSERRTQLPREANLDAAP